MAETEQGGSGNNQYGTVANNNSSTTTDSAAEEVGPSRSEYVAHVQATARETLARSRANNQFRDADQPLDVSERRSRGRRAPLAQPRDRTPAAPAPQPDTQTPTWADERVAVLDAIHSWKEERASVLEAIRSLCELCEALSEKLAELRWRHLGTSFDTPHAAYREMKQWAYDEHPGSTKLDAEEPLEIPSLRALRQT